MSGSRVHPEVEEALRLGEPVVALESAVVTHGLPRESRKLSDSAAPGWRSSEPANLEAVLAMMRAVRGAGATPAVVAVIGGELRLGLDADDLERLALDPAAEKASLPALADVIARGASAGTTVSATLAACASPAHPPVRVFATGGIGGVHRGWTARLDVSADLHAIATTPVCVVCAGAKSILDVEATREALEALGVPLLGYRTDRFPRFHAHGADDGERVARVESAAEIARRMRIHWETLALRTGVVALNPVPDPHALGADEVERAVDAAEALAEAQGVRGRERTPFLLAQLEELTAGRSLAANVALLVANAALAGSIAAAHARAAGAPAPTERARRERRDRNP